MSARNKRVKTNGKVSQGAKAKKSGFTDLVNMMQRANDIAFRPRNDRQRLYVDAINTFNLTFGLGPAGTGKTFVATTLAAQAWLRGDVDKIILTRPAVAAGGEEHGFLPGKINQKVAPWARPVMDLLNEYIGRPRVEQAVQEGLIEVMPFTYMRGLTFENAFVLLDEAQNVTRDQMRLFLTRIGENTKVVVDGDTVQTDLPGNSGLREAFNLAIEHEIPVGLVEFTSDDVERSHMAKLWVKAYEGGL